MKQDPPPPSPALEGKAFLVLLVVVTLALGWILVPFYGAVFWGVVLAIVFAPLYRKLLARFHQSPNLAAIATLTIILLIVILPLGLVTAALLREVAGVYGRVQSGELSFARYFEQIVGALPDWVGRVLESVRSQRPARAAAEDRRRRHRRQPGDRQAGARHRPEHARLRHQLLHHAVPRVLPAARRRRAGAQDLDRDPARPGLQARPVPQVRDRDPRHREGQHPRRRRAGRARRPGVLVPRRPRRGPVGRADGVPVAAPGDRRGADLAAGRDLPAAHRRGRERHRPARLRHRRHRPGRQSAAADPGRQGHQDARLHGADLDARRDGDLRPERLRDRPGDRGDVHVGMGHLRDGAQGRGRSEPPWTREPKAGSHLQPA